MTVLQTKVGVVSKILMSGTTLSKILDLPLNMYAQTSRIMMNILLTPETHFNTTIFQSVCPVRKVVK